MAMPSKTAGPLIGLVVFVILFVLTAATSVYFLTEWNKSAATEAKAKRDLAAIIPTGYLDQEFGMQAQQAAQGEGKTLVDFLVSRNANVMSAVTGETSGDAMSLRGALNLKPDETVKQKMQSLERARAEADNKVGELERAVEEASAQVTQIQAQADEAKRAGEEQVRELQATIAPYAEATKRALESLEELKTELATARDSAKTEYATEIEEERAKQSSLVAANQALTARVQELQKQVDQFRIKPADPALLVDGRVIDVSQTAKDQIFISLGNKDRVRAGMTFEVYPDSSAILYDPKTDRQSPGIASIEIIKVGDTTSTARVTRKAPRATVAKGNVLANAVYSPNYQYKFLVHGKFDVDNDGKITDSEGDYIRAKIREWGGVVVDGTEITPDIDFIVLGSVPVRPQIRSVGADDAAYAAQLEASRAYDSYQALVASASAAQVPVLNWNRFQILTGSSER
ncbi:MAG: hypothetical protein FJ285_03160 [Planctomycetes bacterium]|nr:hypothetical protein [Planctomycetota bacterium]